MDTIVFAGFAPMREQTERLEAEGWQQFPCDDPERGVVGYLMCRDVEGIEETVSLEWPVFGALETEMVNISRWSNGRQRAEETIVDDLARALAGVAGKRAYRADDPKSREVGFVVYGDGRAQVTRIALTVLKEHPVVNGVDLIEFWRSLPELRTEVTPS